MSKIDVVRAAMVQAMKAKDKARKDSLSMLLSALKNAEIDKRAVSYTHLGADGAPLHRGRQQERPAAPR